MKSKISEFYNYLIITLWIAIIIIGYAFVISIALTGINVLTSTIFKILLNIAFNLSLVTGILLIGLWILHSLEKD